MVVYRIYIVKTDNMGPTGRFDTCPTTLKSVADLHIYHVYGHYKRLVHDTCGIHIYAYNCPLHEDAQLHGDEQRPAVELFGIGQERKKSTIDIPTKYNLERFHAFYVDAGSRLRVFVPEMAGEEEIRLHNKKVHFCDRAYFPPLYPDFGLRDTLYLKGG